MTLIRASIMALLFLSGCAKVCTDVGVEGSYDLVTKAGTNYVLQLKPSGEGTLASAGKPIGNLHWKLTDASEQQVVEIDASGTVYSDLSGLTSFSKNPSGTVAVTSGVFGLSPRCGRKGQLEKLVINSDSGLEFVRSQ